jgi:hypothetical protein
MASAHSAHAATPGHQRGRAPRVAGVRFTVLDASTRSGSWTSARAWSVTGQCGRRPSRERYGRGTPACLAAAFGVIQHLHRKERNGL